MKTDTPDTPRLPDVLVLLARIDDDEDFQLWSQQLDEIAALSVTRWWRRVPSRRHAAAIGARWLDPVGKLHPLIPRLVAAFGRKREPSPTSSRPRGRAQRSLPTPRSATARPPRLRFDHPTEGDTHAP